VRLLYDKKERVGKISPRRRREADDSKHSIMMTSKESAGDYLTQPGSGAATWRWAFYDRANEGKIKLQEGKKKGKYGKNALAAKPSCQCDRNRGNRSGKKHHPGIERST